MYQRLLGTALVLAVAVSTACGGNSVQNGSQEPMIPGVEIGEILRGDVAIGDAVRVTGRCLGYGPETAAIGPPPRTRSDWQLTDGTYYVWVVGRLPQGCSYMQGSDEESTIEAVVQEIPNVNSDQSAGTRFLIRTSPD